MLFVNGEIIYINQEQKRWNQIPVLARISTKMPSTSNTTESLNGRPNGKTLLFNVFWGLLHRFRDATMQKIENCTGFMRHKHKYEGRRVQRRFMNVSWARMDHEIAFFLTIDDTCLCGETVLVIEIYRVDCPCSHRFGAYCGNHPGVNRRGRARKPRGPSVPRLPHVVLGVIQDWTQCESRPIVVHRVVFAPGNPFRQDEVE
jgi:hypothetical protein